MAARRKKRTKLGTCARKCKGKGAFKTCVKKCLKKGKKVRKARRRK